MIINSERILTLLNAFTKHSIAIFLDLTQQYMLYNLKFFYKLVCYEQDQYNMGKNYNTSKKKKKVQIFKKFFSSRVLNLNPMTVHQGYSLFHRKPPPKFEIEALFRLVMLYTDKKKIYIIVKSIHSLLCSESKINNTLNNRLIKISSIHEFTSLNTRIHIICRIDDHRVSNYLLLDLSKQRDIANRYDVLLTLVTDIQMFDLYADQQNK
ncbi:hypothetical protein AGLY_012108 [Aphis glycines]|uniref:Uncharacterized protein n=1 Tax=Aphis glycines TaxID=307491 RepID=A0A6G0T952_APHGL|nr:hypothetical protein AGLY_012108 [Aphis glycines]